MKKYRSDSIGLLILLILFTSLGSLHASPTGNGSSDAPPAFRPLEKMDALISLSASVDKLQTDVAALNATLDKYITAGNKCDLDLTVVITGLDIIAIINTDLSNIDQDLAVVHDLLGIAKQIPATKDEASMLMSALEKVKPSVKGALKSTSDANARIIPIRNKLNALDQKIRLLVKTAGTLETVLSVYSTALTKSQQCADGLPDGSTKTSTQNTIDNLANGVDPSVVKANDALVEIINVVNTVERTIQDDLKKAIEPIHQLGDDIDALARKLHGLISPLRDLSALFDKSFSADFPYPSPTWRHPFRMKHYTISIGFRTILQGEDAIQKEIERILSSELYRAAKLFGLGRLVHDIEDGALQELNAIQRRLAMNFSPEVPGLDGIKVNLDAIESALAGIQGVDINTLPIDDVLKRIQADLPTWNNIFSNCMK